MDGRGVARNFKRAVELYQKAADQGDPRGQTDLGVMYENREGVALDHKRAVVLYERATEQGDACARTNLAMC